MKIIRTGLIALSILVFSVANIALLPIQPQAHAATTPCDQLVLRQGSRGTCVKYLQILLNAMYSDQHYKGGYILKTDGIFGKNTYNNVLAFQKWYNSWHTRKFTANGTVSAATSAHLDYYAYRNGKGPFTYWQQKANALPASALGFSPIYY